MSTTPARAHGAAPPSRVTSSSRASSPRARPSRLSRASTSGTSSFSRSRARRSSRLVVAAEREVSTAIADACGGPRALLGLAESRAADGSFAAAAALARHAREAAAAAADGRVDARDDIVARVDVIEREYGFRSILDMYHDAVSRAARTQRKRDAAKPRVRARDRACHRPKARQGWTKAEMRRRRVRTCVGCENMRAREEMFRVIRVREEKTTRVVIDDGAHGRSAYVCKSRACVARAKKNKSVNKALRCAVGTEVMEALEREATAFEEEAGVDTRGLVFERPDGVAGRWEKPGAWV